MRKCKGASNYEGVGGRNSGLYIGRRRWVFRVLD